MFDARLRDRGAPLPRRRYRRRHRQRLLPPGPPGGAGLHAVRETAKAAIEGLTRALAVEYGHRGVRVNAVAPGSVATERYAEFLAGREPAEAARVEREMRLLRPAGRVARPQEIAAAIAHLLSDDASFVNGATVPVNGGRSVLAHDPESRPLPGP